MEPSTADSTDKVEAFEALFTSTHSKFDDSMIPVPEPSLFCTPNVSSQLPSYLQDIFHDSLSDIQASLSSASATSSAISSSCPVSSNTSSAPVPSPIATTSLYALPLNTLAEPAVSSSSSFPSPSTTTTTTTTATTPSTHPISDSIAVASTPIASDTINIVTAQVHSVPGKVDSNLQKLQHIMETIHTLYHHHPHHHPNQQSSSSSVPSDSLSYPDLLVFPETWLMGYSCGIATSRRLAVPLPGTCPSSVQEQRFLQSLGYTDGINPLVLIAQYAKQYGIAIVMGFVERDTTFIDWDDDKANHHTPPNDERIENAVSFSSSIIYNSLGIWDKEGKLVSLYRKTHLWDPYGTYEKVIFTPGPGTPLPSSLFHTSFDHVYAAVPLPSSRTLPSPDDPYQPFTLPQFPHLPIGLLICFDMEFPEPSRILSKRGTKLIIASTAMGEQNAFASRIFARARAAENHTGFVFCNYPSIPLLPSPDDTTSIPLHCSGSSGIVGPDGNVLHMEAAYRYPRTEPLHGTTVVRSDAPLYPSITSSAYDTYTSTLWKSEMNKLSSTDHHLGDDEYLSLIHYNPCQESYRIDEIRNAYLQERRIDLYSKAGI